ncbi:uncharacterized protein LOC111104964 [Crassostrea virginica]
MNLVQFIHLLCCSFVLYSYCECIGLDSSDCDYGYTWNSTEKKCQPCEEGFAGPKCRDPCPFPHYGRGCLMTCNCTEQCHHHHKHGCIASKGTSTNSSKISSILLQTDIKTTPNQRTVLKSEKRHQKDQGKQKQTAYMLKIPIVVFTTMAFILLVFHIFTYSKCFKKCILYEK